MIIFISFSARVQGQTCRVVDTHQKETSAPGEWVVYSSYATLTDETANCPLDRDPENIKYVMIKT